MLVDTDLQGTCRAWAAVAADRGYDGPPVVALDGRSLRRDLERVAAGFDVVIIDTSPRLGADLRAAALASDLVLMPVVPGAADVWALRETVAVVEEAQAMRPDIRLGVVLNRAARTTLTGVTRTALEDLKVQVIGTLGDRVAFGEATAAGRGVVVHAPGSKAALEVKALVRDLLGALGDEGRKGWRARRPRELAKGFARLPPQPKRSAVPDKEADRFVRAPPGAGDLCFPEAEPRARFAPEHVRGSRLLPDAPAAVLRGGSEPGRCRDRGPGPLAEAVHGAAPGPAGSVRAGAKDPRRGGGRGHRSLAREKVGAGSRITGDARAAAR